MSLGTVCGALSSAASVADVFQVSFQQAGDGARVSTIAMPVSMYSTTDQHQDSQDSVQPVGLGLSE